MSHRLYRGTSLLLAVVLVLSLVLAPTPRATAAETAELTILATTDIHGNIYPWDYYSDGQDDDVGLAKIQTLIEKVKDEHPNTLLVDNGDLIQGTPLAYYFAKVEPLEDGQEHPLITVMEEMGYAAGAIGNHEFNYGIPFLDEVSDDADFPFLSANIYKAGTTEPYFTPYVIQDVSLDTGDTVKVGIIGFTTPGIVIWDKANVEGILDSGDIVEAAQRYVPEMQEQGAEVIIALSHSGAEEGSSYGSEVAPENASRDLAEQVEGIDVVVVGHSHLTIPGGDFPDGMVGDTLLVQPGFWGSHLGVATLDLEKTGDGWQVVSRRAELLSTKGDAVPADERILEIAKEAHEKTVEYVTGAVGETQTAIRTHFSRLADTAAMQLINDVQRARVIEVLEGTEYADLPVLSVAAPYKGGRGGSDDYTDIAAGGVSIADVASLYIYDNTLKAFLITGAELDAYLEHTAQNFFQVAPDAGYQPLLNPDWRPYNFDQVDGIEYEIDITKPLGDRVDLITFDGEPVEPSDQFVLASNNYRAGGGGGFPATGNEAVIVYDQLEESRQLIIDYISEQGSIAPYADDNWQIKENFLDHWAAEYAYDLLDREIVRGDDTGRFRLNDEITRAEFVTLLVRALDLPAANRSAPYADVAGHWVQSYVDAAYAAGVLWETDGSFEPDTLITREDAATMLVRGRTGRVVPPGDQELLERFSDADEISSYARGAFAYALERGVFTGDPAGTLRPNEPIRRGEALKIVSVAAPELLPPGQVKVTLLSLNDFHGRMEQDGAKRPGREVGASRLATAFAGEEWLNPDGVLLTNAGDVYQGTTISNLVGGESVGEWLNLIGTDVMTIGNHEFDWTVDTLKDRMEQADFPVLAANIYDEETDERVEWAEPTTMLEVQGVKIGVIGLATPASKTIVLAANVEGIEFRDPQPIVEELAPQLREEGADLVVLVTHLGAAVEDDGSVSDEAGILLDGLSVPVDAVITGHTHSHVAAKVNGVPVVQARSYGQAYGKIELIYDTNEKKVVRSTVKVVEPSQYLVPDFETEELIARWQEVIGPKVNEVLGEATSDFTRDLSPAGESVLGDMIADSQRWKTGADIAIMNGGGIRDNLEAGEVTWGELYAVQPFGNVLHTLEMTGAEVKQVLEEGVEIYYLSVNNLPGGHGPIQVSGLSFTWDYAQPFGERIDPASILLEDGSPIDMATTYTVAANEFIATGGDDLGTFKTASDDGRSTYMGIVDLDAFIEWFEAQPQPVTYELQNRVTVVNMP